MLLKRLDVTILIGLYLLAGLLTLSHSISGLLISMDSLHYFNAARHFANGQGISVLMNGEYQPLTLWPPLQPFILSLFCLANDCQGVAFERVTIVLNLLMLWLSMGLFYAVLKPRQHKLISLSLLAAFILLPGTQIVYMYAWSEVVFIPLILAAFLFLSHYLSDPKQNKEHLLLAMLFIICATYSRYIGLAFSIAVLFSVLVFATGTWLKRLRLVFLCGLIYSLGILPLLYRNFSASGHLSGGERGIPAQRIFEDISRLANLYVHEIFSSYLIWAAIAVVLLGFSLLVLFIEQPNSARGDKSFRNHLSLALIWFFCYVIFLLFSRSIQLVDLDARMMSVAWPFLLLALGGLIKNGQNKNSLSFRLSSITLMIFISAIFYAGGRVHIAIMKNLEQNQEAAWINQTYYLSISGKRFDLMRSVLKHLPLANGGKIVTDMQRPIILSYFYPQAKIYRLPLEAHSGSFEDNALIREPGLLLLSQTQNFAALLADYQGKTEFYAFKAGNGKITYLVTRLPLPRLSLKPKNPTNASVMNDI